MSVEKGSVEQLSPVKKALLTIEKLQQELDAREKAANEPIAIIGMGCRFPGADNPHAFWQLLSEGRKAIREVPGDRFNLAEFYDPDPEAPGKMYMRYGGFLERIDGFDAQFFRISPREAAQMDPQQRLFLELSWEALENAGQPPRMLSGSQTGVFAGVLSTDYAHLPGNLAERVDGYYYTGLSSSFIAGRVSYFLGLHGQSLVVDAACSSSLVAVHLACQSLHVRESDMAIAGGVNLMLSPEISIFLCKAKAMSPTGSCRAFDKDADGMVRGEGGGVVVLKRLGDAVAAGDRILAVIRGSAVNHGGPSGGLTVPNPHAQEMLYRAALKMARVEADKICYVEAHGTGTKLGDPVELQGLAAVFCEGRRRDRPLWIGSVKTNIGHTDSAAGIAGLIKTVLILQHGEIPPSLHFHTPTPEFPWEKFSIAVADKRTLLPTKDSPYLAGVSSFGLSGVNAHVIVQAYNALSLTTENLAGRGDTRECLLPLSARSSEALRDLARSYHKFLLEQHASNTAIRDICATAALRRSHFEHRLAVVGDGAKKIADRLEAFLRGDSSADGCAGQADSDRAAKLAFVFSGQGQQRPGMGCELLRQEPVFREKLEEIDGIFLKIAGWSVMHEMRAAQGDSRINETEVTQPAIFAIQVGLAELWESKGFAPQAVVGHSVGEVAAAHVAGILTLEDAARVIYHRSRLMQRARGMGKMAAVGLSFVAAQELIAPYGERVAIAAENSPISVVLSGEAQALDQIIAGLKTTHVFYRELNVNYAFHTAQMDPYQKELVEALREIKVHPAAMTVMSTVSGQRASDDDFSASYWAKNIRQPVRFANAIGELLIENYNLFLEISSHPVLQESLHQCLDGTSKNSVAIGSLRRGKAERETLLESLGTLYVHAFPIDFRHLYGAPGQPVNLPNYPWQRSRYWVKAEPQRDERLNNLHRATIKQLHPLLGGRFNSAVPRKEIEFISTLSPARLSYLRDHRVSDEAVFPAAAYLEMAIAAAGAALKADAPVLADVTFQQVLTLPDDERKTVHCVVDPNDASRESSFQIFTVAPNEGGEEPSWSRHATGKILAQRAEPAPTQTDLAALQATMTEEVSTDEIYDRVRCRGVDYGPSFRAIEQLWRRDNEALGWVRLPEALVLESDDYKLHPVLLDACFQVVWAILPNDAAQDIYLPVSLKTMRVYGRPGEGLWSYVQMRGVNAAEQRSVSFDIRLFSPNGEIIATVEALQLKPSSREALMSAADDLSRDWLYEVEWRPQPLESQRSATEYLPSPSEIRAAVEPSIAQLVSQPDFTAYEKSFARLEELSVAYVVRAFRQLGWEFQRGQRFSTVAMSKRLGVANHYRRLLGRALEMLSEEKWLRQSGEDWEVVAVPHAQDTEEQIETLIDHYPGAEAELILLERCGSRLAQVLGGVCDPLSQLFPDGDFSTASKLYRESTWARVLNTVLQKTMLSALERLPAGRKVRVLEIGAGTGSTTSYLLPHLSSQQTEYVFTDISPLFLARAKEQFRDYPFVRYQTLDIEQDPETQGFGAHEFDIVVAANVLHATANLRQSLRHVRKALADGGLLLLFEVTAPLRWLDLTFGLTDGWWKFADTDLRTFHPLLSVAKWQQLFEHSGFAASESIPSFQHNCEIFSHHAVVVGNAAPRAEEKTVNQAKSRLIFADDQGVGRRLASLLGSQGELCTLVYQGKGLHRLAEHEFRIDSWDPTGFQRLLQDTFGPRKRGLDHVVYLWSFDASAPEDPTATEMEQASAIACGAVLHLVQALVKAEFPEPPSLTIVTRGAQAVGKDSGILSLAQSPLWGLGRVVALEHPEIWGGLVDLDGRATAADAARQLSYELKSPNKKEQVAYRGRDRYVARLARHRSPARHDKVSPPTSEPFEVRISSYGSLENLALMPLSRRAPEADEVEIQVQVTGLNFRDVLSSLGMLETYARELGVQSAADMPFGYECAGKIVAIGNNVRGFELGDEVIAALAAGCLSSHVTVNAAFVIPKPESLSFGEAATIPIAFLTAYYGLYHLAKMKAGDKVLIHSAAGGVGLAAVQLAKLAGAEIFATASPTKWNFLNSLGVRHVMNSRTTDFAAEVMAMTNGDGVDIVLNSLTGECLSKSIEVCASGGRFVELGHSDTLHEDRARKIPADVSYYTLDLEQAAKADPGLIAAMFRELVDQFKQGSLRPLCYTKFSIQEVAHAFRFMAQAKHIGKVVISQAEEQFSTDILQNIARGNGSYLITGGLGGLGIKMARWLVEQGARHLILCGRRGASATAKETIREIERTGAQVLVFHTDVADREAVAGMLEAIKPKIPPLRGVVHAAGVVDDAVLLQQDIEHFHRVMSAKVEGSWNLHVLTRDLPLDFFVCFSSFVSLLGSPGQANHAAACAFEDALAHYRRARGLPALTISWGPWAGTGALTSLSSRDKARWVARGIDTIAMEQGLKVLVKLLKENACQVGVIPIRWRLFLQRSAEERAGRFFEDFSSDGEPSKQHESDFLRNLNDAPPEKRRNLLVDHVRGQLGKVIGLDSPGSIQPRQRLFDLGIDSLMAVELRNLLSSSLGRALRPTVVFDYPTLETLVDYLANDVLSLESASEASPGLRRDDQSSPSPVLENLSEDEIANLLAEELKAVGEAKAQ